ncbi:MAG TPA: ABC transporter substrate-binding protein [Stellaceae bacterium]|jgi:putative ABC transport system substrate-binding protein
MRRRELLALTAAAIVPFPLAGAVQAQTRPLIGTLTLGSRAAVGWMFETLRRALADLGYGGNIVIESRWADGHADRLPALAAELVRLAPAVIVAGQPLSARALEAATTTMPIVVAVSDNPVAQGLVKSLAHPGGNVTGLSLAQEATVGRELQLLETMAPRIRRVAVLVNAGNPTHATVLPALRQVAGGLHIEPVPVETRSLTDLEPAFATMRSRNVDALVVLGDGLFTTGRKQIIALAAGHRLPAIYHDHFFVEEGGLMSYGGDIGENYRRVAVFIDKILKGAAPADLPVEQPMRFYLYINRETAQALGLTIPPLLLAQADKVIE